MGRRRQSGLFETMLKSTFGVGTTVHYKTDWLGRKQKVVKHHDSGKKKHTPMELAFLETQPKPRQRSGGA